MWTLFFDHHQAVVIFDLVIFWSLLHNQALNPGFWACTNFHPSYWYNWERQYKKPLPLLTFSFCNCTLRIFYVWSYQHLQYCLLHWRLVLQGQIYPALGEKGLACQCLHLLIPPPLPKEQERTAQCPWLTVSQGSARPKALSLGWKQECTNGCVGWEDNDQGTDSSFRSCYESTSKAVGASTTPMLLILLLIFFPLFPSCRDGELCSMQALKPQAQPDE